MSNLNDLRNDLNALIVAAQSDNDQVIEHHSVKALNYLNKLEGELIALHSWSLELKRNPDVDKSLP